MIPVTGVRSSSPASVGPRAAPAPEVPVRIATRLLTLTAALGVAAAAAVLVRGRGEASSDPLASDLRRDLQLATSSVALPRPAADANFALETAPTSAPERAPVVRRASSGPRAVRSPAAHVHASPEPTAAESEETTRQVAQAPAPAETPSEPQPSSEGVALPRPTSIPVSYPAEGRGNGPQVIVDEGETRGGTVGGGIGAVIGPVFGVVIRGGGVGGIDDCEEHDRRRARRGVYRPNPGGIAIGTRRPMIGRGTFPVSH